MSRGIARRSHEGKGVRVHHGVGAVVPVLAAEGTDGQVEFHGVVEYAIAAEYLHSSISENVPCHADARSNLVTPSEGDRVCRYGRGEVGFFARQILFFHSDAGVNRDSMPNR